MPIKATKGIRRFVVAASFRTANDNFRYCCYESRLHDQHDQANYSQAIET